MSFDDLNSFRVYIQTFNDSGEYSGEWVNVTSDVISLGNTGVQIDSSDYDVGVFQNSNLTLTLNNRTGKFNDVDKTESIFNYLRRDSLVKVTFLINEYGPECGIIPIPFLVGEETQIFKGILNDESFKTDANAEDATFKVLGYESLLDRVLVNFSSLSAGDTVEEILYTILNQTEITTLLTVSTGNINAGLDQVSDAVADLEGKTVKEAVDELLLVSNSVLYIDEDDNIIISARTIGATSQITFYGQASPNGTENISSLSNFNNGLHRVFNYMLWTDTTINSEDTDSIAINGLRKKEFDSPIFTNQTKRENSMDALLAEFKDKKDEFEITVPLNYDTIALDLLNKVNVDYPVPVFPTSGEDLPVLGLAILGSGVLPKALWSIEIDVTTNYKIIKKKYNFKNHLITFKLRKE